MPPRTPRPPALVTAAASLGPAATFIPAKKMGWLILKRSVMGVRICSVVVALLLVSVLSVVIAPVMRLGDGDVDGQMRLTRRGHFEECGVC